jgi:hypothetical protein
MKCPECANEGVLGVAFTPTDVPDNFGSTWVCYECHAHIKVASCDTCGRYFPEDDLTDNGPFLCKDCTEVQQRNTKQ